MCTREHLLRTLRPLDNSNVQANEARAWSSSVQIWGCSLGRQGGLSLPLNPCLQLWHHDVSEPFLNLLTFPAWLYQVFNHIFKGDWIPAAWSRSTYTGFGALDTVYLPCVVWLPPCFHLESQVVWCTEWIIFLLHLIFPSGSPVRMGDSTNYGPCSLTTRRKQQKSHYFRNTTTHLWSAISYTCIIILNNERIPQWTMNNKTIG